MLGSAFFIVYLLQVKVVVHFTRIIARYIKIVLLHDNWSNVTHIISLLKILRTRRLCEIITDTINAKMEVIKL